MFSSRIPAQSNVIGIQDSTTWHVWLPKCTEFCCVACLSVCLVHQLNSIESKIPFQSVVSSQIHIISFRISFTQVHQLNMAPKSSFHHLKVPNINLQEFTISMILFLSQQQSLLHAPSKIQQSLFLKLPTLYHFIFLVSECFVFKAYSVSWVGICRVGICLIFPFMLIITQHFRNKKLLLFTLLKVYSFYFVFYSILAMYICFM